MMKPPRIEAVDILGPNRLRVAWTTGERLAVDLQELMVPRMLCYNVAHELWKGNKGQP